MNNNYTYPNQSTAPPYQNFDFGFNNPNIAGSTNINNNSASLLVDPNYAENILELNVGKYARFYMSYSDSLEWRDKIFSGTITAAGRDFAVINDENTNTNFLLWTVYLNYVEFPEDIILKG